jgi:hypothetical protein
MWRHSSAIGLLLAVKSRDVTKPEPGDVFEHGDPQGDPVLAIRATRPYGDVQISTSSRGDDAEEFLRRARHWFEAQPEQLLLIGQSGVGSESEVDQFTAAATSWTRKGRALVANFGIAYVPQPDSRVGELGRPTLPPPIVGDRYSTTALVARRSVSTYIQARDDERFDTSSGVAIRHVEGRLVAEVEMRDGLSVPDHSAIRSVAAQLGGIDEDVLDVVIANAVRNGAGSDGLYEVDVDAIVAARGRGGKTKREGSKLYSSGMRDEARDAVIDALEALDRLYVSLDDAPRRRQGKVVRDYDRVFDIRRKTLEEGTERVIAVGYSFGEWFSRWRDGLALAPRALLALDARNGAPAKALGRYFMLLGPEADASKNLIRPIREVLLAVRRTLDYGKNPQRLRSWLEDNLEQLRREQVIAAWSYHPSQAIERLPRYKWIDAWLELSIKVTLETEVANPVG